MFIKMMSDCDNFMIPLQLPQFSAEKHVCNYM